MEKKTPIYGGFLTEAFIESTRHGELPDEFRETDIQSLLASNWASVISQFGISLGELDFDTESWRDAEDSEVPIAWWSGLQLACAEPARFLFMLPIGSRDYGRGDQDKEAMFTLFFDAGSHVVRVTAFAFQPYLDGIWTTYEPLTCVTLMRTEPGPGLMNRSLTAFQWRYLYGTDARIVNRYFKSRGFNASGDQWGFDARQCDPGPKPERRSSLHETRWDLIEMQASCIALSALQAGAGHMNQGRDAVSDAMRQLASELQAYLYSLRAALNR